MTIFLHELKRNRLSLILWTAVISFMLGVCIVIYPEMSTQMGDISDMFADMGSFSAAFGMDQINFGEFVGFFGVECGNVLGLGGAFFAAILGISALGKEEKEHTAEFLLTHPITRTRVIAEKFATVMAQIVIMNLAVAIVTMGGILMIGEEVDAGKIGLLLLANLLMHVEIGAITFGISAFLKSGGLGIGLGIAVAFYFLNILANLSEDIEFLKYVTPFGYTDGSDIIAKDAIKIEYLLVGGVFAGVGIVMAFWKYRKKNIA